MSLHLLLRPSISRHVGRNGVELLNEQYRQPPLHHTRPGCPRGPHRRWIERNRAWWPVVPTFIRPRAASMAPATPNPLGPTPTGWGTDPPTPPTPPTRSGMPAPTRSGLSPNLLGVPPTGWGRWLHVIVYCMHAQVSQSQVSQTKAPQGPTADVVGVAAHVGTSCSTSCSRR